MIEQLFLVECMRIWDGDLALTPKGASPPRSHSNRDRKLDWGMRIVIENLEVFEPVIENGGRLSFQNEPRKRARRAGQLFAHTLNLIHVNVAVTSGPNEVPRAQIRLLGNHVREE